MTDHLTEIALQLSALNALVAKLASDIGELKEFRAIVESQMEDGMEPNVDMDGNPIRAR